MTRPTAPALHRLCTLLMLVPFLLLALIPAAAMPVAGADGRYTVVLCTGDGPLAVMLDAEGNPVAPAPGRCDWAAATPAALAEGAAPLPAPPLTLRPAAPARPAQGVARTHEARGVFARGPPLPI